MKKKRKQHYHSHMYDDVVFFVKDDLIDLQIGIYFGEWIKSVLPINLIVLLLLVHVVYIGIRCYVKDWLEERGYY